jgi:addiction module HigA family antidote
MPMKNPSHPGELVRDNLEDLGLSVAEAATELGVTREELEAILAGTRPITPDVAVRIEETFGGTLGLWLRMQANYDARTK